MKININQNTVRNYMKTRTAAIAMCIAFIVTASAAWAQIPHTFSVQGLLSNENGSLIASGYHQVQFNIYTVATDGAPIHSETQMVLVQDGIVNAILGTTTPFAAPVGFDRQYYLGIRIDGGAELRPRTEITATPYAIRADMANKTLLAEHATYAEGAGHADDADHADHASTADMALDLSPNATSVVRSLNNRTGNLKIVGAGSTWVTQSGDTVKVGSTDNVGITTVLSLDPAIGVLNPTGPEVQLNIGGNAITSFHLTNGGIATVDLGDGIVTEQKIGPNAVPADRMNTYGATTMGQVLMYDGESTTPMWSNIFRGDGCGLMNLNASHLTRGMVHDNRLSPNVALRNAENNFTGDINTFRGIASEGVSINSPAYGKGLEITRGRTILSYGSVVSGHQIPADITIARVGSNGSFSMATVGFPESDEHGQVLYVTCDDPQGCRVIEMSNPERSEADIEALGLGHILLYHQVGTFILTEDGWLRAY